MKIAGSNETTTAPTPAKDDTVPKKVPAGVSKTGAAKAAVLPMGKR